MLSSSRRLYKQIGRVGNRCLYTHALREDFLLPFKYDFVTPELKCELEKRGVNSDDVDRMYNHQIQNDQEFNNRCIPRRDSPLWGYIYGTQLARFQTQLDNLTAEQEFARGYLEAHIKELDMKMRRYYPELNYEGTERQENANAILDEIEARVTAEYIAEDAKDFIKKSFGNNWFVGESDSDDTYNDYLPRELEDKLIQYYQFDWDCTTGTARPQYVSMLNELDAGLKTRVDSLKGLLIPAFESLLNSLSTDPSKESALADTVAVLSKCPSIITDNQTGKDCPGKLIDVLFGGNSKISAAGGALLGSIFGCNGQQFANKTRDEAASIVSTFSEERVGLLYKAAQARQSLKSESLSKLLLTLALNSKPFAFAQFACGGVTVSDFLAKNQGALDKVVASLLENQKAHKKVASSLKAVLAASTAALEGKGVPKAMASATVSDLIGSVSSQAPSLVGAYYRQCFEKASANGDVVGQIDAQVMSEYLDTPAGQGTFYNEAVNQVVMPGADGLEGIVISGSAHALANGSFAFFDDLVDHMKANALLDADAARSAKGDLVASVDESFASLRSSGKELVQAQDNLSNAILALAADCDDDFDFDRIKNTYNPLDMVVGIDCV